jgi:hypothetical protein
MRFDEVEGTARLMNSRSLIEYRYFCERPMALILIQDSLTRSVSEGIHGENELQKALANASGS